MRSLLKRLFSSGRSDLEAREELESHIRMRAELNQAQGMSRKDSQTQARRQFGNRVRIEEDVRNVYVNRLLETTAKDIRFAVRQLRRNKGFAIVAILTTALGIGAATAVFSQVNAVFLSTVMADEVDELRILTWTSEDLNQTNSTFPVSVFRSMRDGSTGFSDLACWWAGVGGVGGEWGHSRLQLVSGNYFELLGVPPALGRFFSDADDQRGDPRLVAVISYGLWQSSFGGSPDVLGRVITVRSTPFEIIGVMPKGMTGLNPMSPRDLVLPISAMALATPFRGGPDQWNGPCSILGRLRTGEREDRAALDAGASLRQAMSVNPPPIDRPETATIVLSSLEGRFGAARRRTALPLFLLVATVGAILVIACTNVAGLLMTRSRSRGKEIVTRLALGASRTRVIRQLLTESLLLSLAGAVLGLGFSYAIASSVPALLGHMSANLGLNGETIPVGVDSVPDARVLVFAAALTILTGLGFGLAPALNSTRFDLVSVMKQVPTGGWRRLGGRIIIAVQVALAVLLLLVAGLFVRTARNLDTVEVGFVPEGLLFFVAASSDRPDFTRVVRNRLESIPGVQSAAVSGWPLFNNAQPKIPICLPDEGRLEASDFEWASTGFFETWGVRILAGRGFGETSQPVAIVNETFAERAFGGRNAIGQAIGIPVTRMPDLFAQEFDDCPVAPATVVGVVADHRDRQREVVTPMVYVPYTGDTLTEPITFAVRTRGPAAAMITPVRQAVDELGIYMDGDVATGTQYTERNMKRERLLAGLLVLFASLAVLLASLGLYGTLACLVHQRTPEIGMRMALGAERAHVTRLIARESLIPVVFGVPVGIASALVLTRWIESLFFGIFASDTLNLVTAALVFVLFAAAAAWLPARRASSIDPMAALRHE